MKDFFVGSSAFGLPHILLLLFYVLLGVGLILILKLVTKTPRSKNILINCVALATLLVTIFSRFIYAGWDITFTNFFPTTSCALTGFIVPLVVLFSKKDSGLLYFACFAGLLGGLSTVLICDFIGQPQFANTMISCAYHSLMAITSLLVFFDKRTKPTMKKMSALYVGYSAFIILSLFITDVWKGADYAYLTKSPVAGLTWWSIGFIIFGVQFIISAIYEACKLKKEDQALYKLFIGSKNYCIKTKESCKSLCLKIKNSKKENSNKEIKTDTADKEIKEEVKKDEKNNTKK